MDTTKQSSGSTKMSRIPEFMYQFRLTVLYFLIHSASAADTLSPRQFIQDGESLVSANGTFELGFFSPRNSSNRYVGIWYHNISVQTVVWVANRNWPLFDTSGQVTFTSDTNLMVLDGRGASFVFTYGASATGTTTATILDNGNFVLRDAKRQILWQSFDNPTDHFLPGMRLGMVGNLNRLLTSWRSSDNPSMGDFSFGANPHNSLQLFIWQQDRVYWTTGPWNGATFTFLPELSANQPCKYNLLYVNTVGNWYWTFTPVDQILRFTINPSGQLSLLCWLDLSQEWLLFFAAPRPQCDLFNRCGSFGVCSESPLPVCDCLKGFQPGSLSDWRKGSTGGGCVRETGLQCQIGGKPDGFQPVHHVKFPINGMKSNEGTASQCESACLKNCTCTAYGFTDTCRLWYGDITTLQQMDNGANDSIGTLYLRLAASEFRGNDKKRKIVVSILVIFMSLTFSIVSFLCWRRYKGRQILSQEQSIQLLGAEIAKSLGESDKRASEFTLFDFSRVTEATNNFSSENKLGQGGFGPVYKGILAGDQEIAVKRLSARSGQGLEEFKNEILLIAKLQHRNLVRLLGCCIQRDEKILICEYMRNKSLDFFLFDRERRAQLDWSRRFHIIEGIAQGLVYLHKHSRLQIIHRDLKASNVLLDADMNPKISDFGLARIFNPNQEVANTIRVVGTYGYMPPEYVSEGLFSIKSDVFSFGVLLLEIVTGKRNTGLHQYKNSFNFVGYAWEMWKDGKSLDLMDTLLGDTFLTNEVTRCIHVGLLCVQENAADRPNMTDVISMLSSETAPSSDPKQPAFFTMRTPTQADLPEKTGSLNNVTVTSLDGR